jgi:hypothetical protein
LLTLYFFGEGSHERDIEQAVSLGLKASTKNDGDTPSGQGVIDCNSDAGIAFDYAPHRSFSRAASSAVSPGRSRVLPGNSSKKLGGDAGAGADWWAPPTLSASRPNSRTKFAAS